MQTIGNIALSSDFANDLTTNGIWPVWRDSIASPVKFTSMTRQQAAKIWHKARKWDHATHEHGKHGGIVGRSALAVLYALLYEFYNFRTGRLDPTIKTISERSGVAPRTVHKALNRLRELRILDWQRRCEHARSKTGQFLLRQLSNAYQVAKAQLWGREDRPDAPAPNRDTLGYPAHYPEPVHAASQALREGNRAAAYSNLLVDEGDKLAIALAQLGRAMGAI